MINTSGWEKFKIGDLFELSLSSDDIQPKKIIDGETPLISSSKTTNGVIAYIKDDEAVLQSPNTITVDMFGKAFYQEKPYFAVSHGRVNILTPKFNMTKNIGLFLASTIEVVSDKRYGFNEMCTGVKLAKDTIKLPVTPKGQPDWGYMESYMESAMEGAEDQLKNLEKINDTKRLINIDSWSDFDCRELFECKNTGNILARDIVEGGGDTPYVTASGYNNGVAAYIDASSYETIKGHCILIGGKTFTVTYQKDDFVSNDSHNFTVRVKNHDISELSYLYLVSVFRVYFGQKFSWNDAVTKNKLMAEKLPLPATSMGEPDWQFMDSYMREQIGKSESVMAKLQSVV